MSAPLAGRGPVRALVATLVAVLVAALLASVAPGRASARGDIPGVDAPVLPPGCFGPARPASIDPFPCPLNPYRPKRPTVLLWGDSHAYEWIPALREATKGERINLVSFVAGSCPPVLVPRPTPGGACLRSNYVALRTVEKLVRTGARFKVIIGSNWTGFRRAYRRVFLADATGAPSGYEPYTEQMVRLAHEGTPPLFDRLASMGVDVDIIAQSATVPSVRPPCAAGDEPYNCDVPRWRALPEERRTHAYLVSQQDKIQVNGRSRIIDATSGYCTTTVCHGKIGAIETYFDDLHLSATRTRALARFFKPAVRDLQRRR